MKGKSTVSKLQNLAVKSVFKPTAPVRVPNEKPCHTPWSRANYLLIIQSMNNKIWLVEIGVAACLMAVTNVAFTLMLGNNLWKSLASK
jgi:hypothetical protein